MGKKPESESELQEALKTWKEKPQKPTKKYASKGNEETRSEGDAVPGESTERVAKPPKPTKKFGTGFKSKRVKKDVEEAPIEEKAKESPAESIT